MENYRDLKPLTETERQYASNHYDLIARFLKMEKQNPEDMFDIVVFGYLLSVEKYLSDTRLQREQSFETVSYMYMKRALYRHYREQKTQRRTAEGGADISFDEIDIFLECNNSTEKFLSMEYREMIGKIKNEMTAEQQKIFDARIEGYNLKEIALMEGIKEKRVYKQFAKVKEIVSKVMELKQV